MHYTYAHYTDDTSELFYIGKGQKRRHLVKSNRSKLWKNKVDKHGFYSVILAKWKTQKEAFDHEKLLIKVLREMNVNLVNLTDGGDGISGHKRSEALKQHMSRKMTGVHKGKAPWNKGIKGVYVDSDETRKRKSLSHIGKPVWNKGVTAYNKGIAMSEAQKLLLRKPKPKVTCECGKTMPLANIRRWHLDENGNCKKR
jgi:hypothetical protein